MAGGTFRKLAELTFAGGPGAVPRARRLACDALAADWPEAVADAELVISELVTNATLHGEPPVVVRVLASDRIRVEVLDRGREAPILLGPNAEAMTGRGLGMVAALAAAWGVEPLDRGSGTGGKVVWAELGGGSTAGAGPGAERDIEALLAAWSDEDPAITYTVRLGAVPTRLLLSAKAHIDNVVRELTLLREGETARRRPLSPELEALIETVTGDFASARAEIKRQAAAAAARGDDLTDLELHLRPAAADAGRRYLDALDQADRYARASNLLTLAPPRAHRLFREWYVGCLVEQLEALGRGETPLPARSFQVVLAEEVDRLAEQADMSGRLRILQSVSSDLARARTVGAMAEIVVAHAVRFLGVQTARVRLLDRDGMLRSVAWRSRDRAEPEPVSEYSVQADLPGARVVRTGRPEFIRSVSQAAASLPDLSGLYPSSRSGHAVPLPAGNRSLGLISLTFTSGELSDTAELAVVESLAGVLAQSLQRAPGPLAAG